MLGRRAKGSGRGGKARRAWKTGIVENLGEEGKLGELGESREHGKPRGEVVEPRELGKLGEFGKVEYVGIWVSIYGMRWREGRATGCGRDGSRGKGAREARGLGKLQRRNINWKLGRLAKWD